MKGLITVFFVLIFFCSCDEKQVPKGILKEEEMIKLLTDLHIADGYSNSAVHDTLAKYGPVIYGSIFNKFHTDSASFDRSMKYYTADPDKFLQMYERVEKNLRSLEKAARNRAEREAAKKPKAKPVNAR